MKTDIKSFAQFIAASIWADGEFQEQEKRMLKEIELVFNLPVADVEYIIEEYNALTEDEVTSALVEAAKSVDPSESKMILELILQFIISDGILTADEISNYYSLASILGVSIADADEMFDQTIDEFDDLVIEDAD